MQTLSRGSNFHNVTLISVMLAKHWSKKTQLLASLVRIYIKAPITPTRRDVIIYSTADLMTGALSLLCSRACGRRLLTPLLRRYLLLFLLLPVLPLHLSVLRRWGSVGLPQVLPRFLGLVLRREEGAGVGGALGLRDHLRQSLLS